MWPRHRGWHMRRRRRRHHGRLVHACAACGPAPVTGSPPPRRHGVTGQGTAWSIPLHAWPAALPTAEIAKANCEVGQLISRIGFFGIMSVLGIFDVLHMEMVPDLRQTIREYFIYFTGYL